MYLTICLDKAAGCKQKAFEKHLDVSDIHLKFALNSHECILYKPRWVKEFPTRQPYKDQTASTSYLVLVYLCRYINKRPIKQ